MNIVRKGNMTPTSTGLMIAEIERRSLLWNTNSPFYKDKVKRTEAWREIAKVVYPDSKGKISEVKKIKEIQGRWKSIRDSYAKHMKKVQRVGANGLQSKSYIFAPHLTFLDKFLTCRVAEEQADTVAGGRNTGRSDFQQHRGEAQAAESDAQESSEEEEEEESDNQGRVEEERRDAHKFHRKLRVNLVPVSVKPDPESSQDLDTALDTSNSHDHGQSAAEDSKFDLWLLEDMVRRVVKETGVEKDADMAFFTMLLPTLRNFTEDQKLEFRTEVLLTMRAIKAGASKATLVSASTSATCTSSLH